MTENREHYWEGKLDEVIKMFPREDTDLFKSQEDWEDYLRPELKRMPCVMINSLLALHKKIALEEKD